MITKNERNALELAKNIVRGWEITPNKKFKDLEESIAKAIRMERKKCYEYTNVTEEWIVEKSQKELEEYDKRVLNPKSKEYNSFKIIAKYNVETGLRRMKQKIIENFEL